MDASASPQERGRSGPARDQDREARLLFMRRLIHDLNNALSVITINVGLMQEEAQDDETRELLDEIAKAVQQSATLTTQLRRIVMETSESLPTQDLHR
ncbi:MAG TPA: histidine kinase dimerization/phospho-acceptor domain-containing protein [Longimicrobiales bacterium]|nr:histidine kinase dimerization/phospho-acceptor domain-containing protein [Longimicrobiales bacterium]